MNRLPPRLAAATTALAAVVAGTSFVPAPAIAQATRNAEIIVYGTDPCPRSTDDTIVVCKRLPETQRFRLPPNLRPQAAPQVRNSWVNRSKVFANQSGVGPMACSAIGPAGQSGCALQEINQAAREQREAVDAAATPTKK